MKVRTLAVVGPTASGKSTLSLDVAEMIARVVGCQAEIVNADSMQLYRGMDIGTAKLSVAERRNLTHHMLDVLDVTQTANVADYQKQARHIIRQIHDRGNVAIIVGGSGLFVHSVLDDMQFPGSDSQIRESLIAQAELIGTHAMYDLLVQHDPEAAANVLPTNLRRIIRALEVIQITGSAPATTFAKLPEVVRSVRVGLRVQRAVLDERISNRVEQMWQAGFVEEVQKLEAGGLRTGLTASKALGYQQILSALSGEISLEEAKAATVNGTRRLARRQESWFNRDHKIHWCEAQSVTAQDVLTLAGMK